MKISTVLAMVAALSAAVVGLTFLTGGPPAPPPPPPKPATETVAKTDAPTEKKTDPAEAKKAPEDDGPDFHLENPFPLDTKAAKKPVATTESVNLEFGAMAPNEEKSHKFKIRNTGDAPLKLAKGRYQCKCTMPTMKKGEVREIAPGEETEIEMTWRPLAPDSMFMKTVDIWTNDPDHPKLQFSVQGSVVPHIVAEPSSYSLGLLRNESGGDFTGYLVSSTDKFEILENGSDNPQITATVELVPADEIPGDFKEAKTLYRIKGKVSPSDKIGNVSGMLTFKTNLESHQEVTAPVSAQFTGPFMILGFGWDQSKTSLDVERVEVAKGKTKKFSWFLPKMEEEFQLTSVEAKPNIARMTVTKDKAFSAVDRDKYDLEVEILPGAPKGEFNLTKPVSVTVKTNHPRVPELTFKILYRGY